MISTIFNKLFYQPIFNILIFFVHVLPRHDFGIATIFLTLLIRTILHPLFVSSFKSQKKMAEIQPKISEIQNRHKDDKEKQIQETIKLYRLAKINPFGSFLTTILQIPILIALFWVLTNFSNGLEEKDLANLYFFIPPPINFTTTFLGMVDLSRPFWQTIDKKTFYYWPAFPLIFLAGILSFSQIKLSRKNIKKEGKNYLQDFQRSISYFFLFFSFLILAQLPSAIALYWLVNTLYSLIEQKLILKI